MRTLHKLTHRPLALMALFVGLGALGWQLPGLGSAALAYSRQAVQAARTTLIQRAPSTPAPVAAQPGAAKAAVARTAVQQTPGQQAVAAAKAALDAAVAARAAGKAGETAVDTALANYNAAVQVRLAEIRNRLNEIGVAINNPTTQNGVTRDNATGSNGAEYDALVAELKDLGGFPQAINAPAPVNINEVEPNDTSATAQNIALAGTVTQVSGSIGVAADADFYRVALTAGSKVWVYVDTGGTQTGGTSRDSQLTLLGTDGTTTLEFDDDDGTSNGGDNTVESGLGSAIGGFPITTTGNYFLKVNAFSATGLINPYKVFIVVTNAATTTFSETEPNDTAATANAFLSAAQTTAIVNGTCATNAIDFYTVTANAGDLLYVNLDGDPERNGTGTDVALSLRDSLGTTVFVTSDSSNGGTGPNPPSENFSFLFTTSGTFTLRVFGFGGTDPNVTYSLMGTLVTPSNACPPVAGITATLGGASTFPRVTGTQTQRLNRDGVTSACGVARTQAAPFAATRTFDAYTFPVGGVGTQCFTIGFAHSGTGTAEIMVGAYLNTFNPANMTQNWLGDFGFSITPAGAGTVNTFSVNAAAGNNIVIVVFDGGSAAGTAFGYNLQVSGNITGCATPCSITCPANITQNVDAGLCTAVVNYPAPTTSGTCNTVTCTPASGSTFAKGVTTVTCTSTGNLNGTATCSFTVTVVDNIPPTVAAVPDISVGTTGTGAVVTYTNPTATDNCPGVSAVTCTPPSGSTFAVGTTTVTCSATDAVNLTGSTTFRVFVNRLAVGSLSDPLACTGPGSKPAPEPACTPPWARSGSPCIRLAWARNA